METFVARRLAARYLSLLLATLFATNAAVTLAIFARAWRAYRDAYSDVPHDAISVAGSQLTMAAGLVLDIVLCVMTVVLAGRTERGLTVAVTGLGLLRFACCNTTAAVLAQNTTTGPDQTATDLRHAIPSWARHTSWTLQAAILLTLVTTLVLVSRKTVTDASPARRP
jgi:hypothetical protein